MPIKFTVLNNYVLGNTSSRYLKNKVKQLDIYILVPQGKKSFLNLHIHIYMYKQVIQLQYERYT